MEGPVNGSGNSRRRSRSWLILNCYFTPKEYACRDTATGALHPVPPGRARAELFCPQCRALTCLLDRDRPHRTPSTGRTYNNRVYREACRAAGISTRGRPLARRCWNCIHIRRIAEDVYVCHWRHSNAPVESVLHAARSRKTMLSRAPSVPVHGCGGVAFVLRRGPIEDWDLQADAA